MSRPVPSQVIPRPAHWQAGDPAPWAALAPAERRGITLARVLAALTAKAQRGIVPEALGAPGTPGPAGPSPAGPGRAINAAVLVLLFEEEGEAKLTFTRRSALLRLHQGEVSFPGGRLDPGEGPRHRAALREAYEEVALDPATVTLEGWMNPVPSELTGSLIRPIVATVPGRPRLEANPAEVERIFDVSFRDLADPENFHEERWSHDPGSAARQDPVPIWFFEVEGEMIWGATARMIYELLVTVLDSAG